MLPTFLRQNRSNFQFLIKNRRFFSCNRSLCKQQEMKSGSSVKPGTFEHDESLPNLTVPDLNTTILKYLDSVKAVATDEEFTKTFGLCQKFLCNEGPILQEQLKKREKVHRNWVEEWWLDHAYLHTRTPMTHQNFSGVCTLHEKIWPAQPGSQVKRAAFSLHLLASFWKDIREERVKTHTDSRGKPFCMNQYKSTYNMTRVPGKEKDSLVSHFRLSSEGECPSHSVVICRGQIFTIQLFDERGNIHSAPQFEIALSDIVHRKSLERNDDHVACMTSLRRDEWAEMRERLMRGGNARSLELIESAVHVLCLSHDDLHIQTPTQVMRNAMCGDSALKWRDKSYCEVWTTQGLYAAHCDHTPIDGMVQVLFIQYLIDSLMKCEGKWENYKPLHIISDERAAKVEDLKFVCDDVIREAIERGREESEKFGEELQVEVVDCQGVGRNELKQIKVHPDGFVQICLQLAYMRLHGRPAATYETATARRYYHGRTETCRTCTPELVKFCRRFISHPHHQSSSYHLLLAAHRKYAWLMRECEVNRGCDRHLFALQLQAQKNGISPGMFSDEMFVKSGGKGNFDLSTSFVGFYNATGAVAPMKEDGYGCFYRLNSNSISYSLLSCRSSPRTSVSQLKNQISLAVRDVYQLFVRNRAADSKV